MFANPEREKQSFAVRSKIRPPEYLRTDSSTNVKILFSAPVGLPAVDLIRLPRVRGAACPSAGRKRAFYGESRLHDSR
jgi:hypothetical protein